MADVGCGYGTALILLAKAYPRSRFVGFDVHEPSIETARKRAAAAGVSDRVRFEVSYALMLVEHWAADDFEENIAMPAAGLHYAVSTFLCTPNSLSQPVGLALGAQPGEPRLREVLVAAGYRSVRRVAETPFNIVLEARP